MNERLNEIINKVKEFRDVRDWKKFHDPKNLAEAISIESAELLETFLWMTTDESKKVDGVKIDKIKEEIADMIIYIIYLCDALNIDLIKEVENKIAINETKYPVQTSKGRNLKYTEFKNEIL